MKLIVDKVPDNVMNCEFSQYSGSGYYECTLTTRHCPLCYNRVCDKLVGIDQLYVTTLQGTPGNAWFTDRKVEIKEDING